MLPGPRVFQDAKEIDLNCIGGMSCDHGYTLRQCEAEPHLFVDGDSIKFCGSQFKLPQRLREETRRVDG